MYNYYYINKIDAKNSIKITIDIIQNLIKINAMNVDIVVKKNDITKVRLKLLNF